MSHGVRRMAVMDHPLPTRFAAKIQPLPNGCWQWMGTITSNGYPHYWMDGKPRLAHRLMYEWMVGPIPEGLYLDHVCHNADIACPGAGCRHQSCVNPAHLEPVTPRENAHRSYRTQQSINTAKTHCPKGHPYSGENLYLKPCGRRVCRTCAKAGNRRRWQNGGAERQQTYRARKK